MVVMRALAEGKARLTEVSVFYVHNRPDQVHAVYAGGDTGHSIDVYLTGKALQDFFESGSGGV